MIRQFDGENAVQVADEIWELLDNVYGESPWTRAMILSELTEKNHAIFLSTDDETGELTGFLSVVHVMNETEITNLAVRKSQQKRHIATQLLARLTGNILLEVRASNRPALHLYTNLGFLKLAERKNYYQNPREDAIIMKRYD